MASSSVVPAGIAEVKILRAGQWEKSSTTRFAEVFNPSTGEVIARAPLCPADEVGGVVEAASAAGPAWAETPVVERARVMFKFRELLLANFERLSLGVCREHGKTLA